MNGVPSPVFDIRLIAVLLPQPMFLIWENAISSGTLGTVMKVFSGSATLLLTSGKYNVLQEIGYHEERIKKISVCHLDL